MEQNKGRTALVMGIIMIILGAAALLISLGHPRGSAELPGSSTTTLPAAVSAAQPVDDRADELARQLKASQEKLTAAEQRLIIERGANEGIRKEINEIRLARQDVEARLQSVEAERALEKKTMAAVQANLDKANTELARYRADSEAVAAAMDKAQAELAETRAKAVAELANVRAEAAADAAAAQEKAAITAARMKAEIEKLTAEIAQLKAQLAQVPAPPAPAPVPLPETPAPPAQ